MTTATAIPADLLQSAGDLRVALGRLVRRLRQSHEAGGLTPAGLSLLSRLDEHGQLGPAGLAEVEHVSAPVICEILNGLQQRGLVARAPDPNDGRRVVMSLTAAGRQELTARRSALSRRVAVVLAERFTDAERERLLAVVPLLQRLGAEL